MTRIVVLVLPARADNTSLNVTFIATSNLIQILPYLILQVKYIDLIISDIVSPYGY